MKRNLLILCALFSTLISQGQIIYTELSTPVEIKTDWAVVNPTQELGYEINLLGGNTEFYVQNYGANNNTSYIACFEEGSGIVTNANGQISLLTINTAISNASNFLTCDLYGVVFPIIHNALDYTVWVGQTGYAGFKFSDGINTHYGWIKLKVATTPTNPTFTIYSYAYNSTANQQILAGQTTLDLKEINIEENIKVYPTLSSNSIKIEGIDKIESIAIYDILGKMVKEINTNTKDIDISSLNPNTYFVRISADNKVVQRKFIKQ